MNIVVTLRQHMYKKTPCNKIAMELIWIIFRALLGDFEKWIEVSNVKLHEELKSEQDWWSEFTWKVDV